MKKILLAFDGNHFSEAALDFARKINEKEPILLVGAFLPQVDYANLWSFAGNEAEGAKVIPLLEDSTTKEVQYNIHRFESYCRHNKINFRTHSSYLDFAMPELKKESRFTDLLIVSSQEFYKQAGTDLSNLYLREILHDLECPVLVIPEKHVFPVANILTYDGSASSVFAIRQFAYLFPEWTKHPTTILYTTTKEGESWPHEKQIKELVKTHFGQVDWQLLLLSEKSMFSSWLMENENAIVVSGSFGRGGLSMMFKKSFITDAINEHQLPVFITHK